MTIRLLLLSGLTLLTLACSVIFTNGLRAAPSGQPATAPAAGQFPGIAVLELFTSEGCSSCPPADQVLNDWVGKAAQQQSPVYPLAFHVDYWDRLGWKDRFSSAESTARQRAYAAAMNTRQLYTPQLVVNGSSEFVGSDAREASRQVATALSRPALVGVSIKPEKGKKSSIQVGYEVAGSIEGAVINVAVVERGLTSVVTRGENARRSLTHDTVRGFLTAPLDASKGRVEVSFPADMNPRNAKVIGYVQNGRTLAVLGATETPFPP
ncbi:DUF1223 domain-containing protein [Humisphaera borealis]|uniref:DUF1223 domain-containing protein n=1 Tax=Humisphaera borealis TaxID=2807512 RepID=A0A7M2WW76_9BACT|nr:DUF1223 domain-containing protein [Humisphaera borealis]QOV88750.1 DUF1223 domain-containing protein [Humisphaera borealis]